MRTEDAIRAIAEDYDLDVGDLKIALKVITRGEASKARWIDLFRVANGRASGHSGTVTLNFSEGCITSDGMATSLRAAAQTLSDGRNE